MSEPPAPVLTDGTIALRAWRASDVPALAEACRDPEIVRWTRVPSPYTEDDARMFLVTRTAREARGEERYFAIVEAPDGELVGSISLRPAPDRRAAIGYFVAAPARGRGVAVRAVGLIAGWAFAELGSGRLEIVTDPDNLASQRVAERAGFTREAVLRSYLEVGGERSDGVMFSLLPGD